MTADAVNVLVGYPIQVLALVVGGEGRPSGYGILSTIVLIILVRQGKGETSGIRFRIRRVVIEGGARWRLFFGLVALNLITICIFALTYSTGILPLIGD